MVAYVLFAAIFGLNSAQLTWFRDLYSHTNVVTYGLMTLYVTSVTFRAFRVRNWETLVMMICCVLTLLRASPPAAAIFPSIEPITMWLLQWPVGGGTRGLYFCLYLGSISYLYRVLLGRERSHLAGGT